MFGSYCFVCTIFFRLHFSATASKINFAQLPVTLQQLKSGLKKIENLIQSTREGGPNNAGEMDRFADEAASFAFSAKKTIERTSKIIEQIDAKFCAIATRCVRAADKCAVVFSVLHPVTTAHARVPNRPSRCAAAATAFRGAGTERTRKR